MHFHTFSFLGNTPKYGLIFHSSFIGRAGAKNKGRISRYLANKCSIASRIDCFMEQSTNIFGTKLVNNRTFQLPSRYSDYLVRLIDYIQSLAIQIVNYLSPIQSWLVGYSDPYCNVLRNTNALHLTHFEILWNVTPLLGHFGGRVGY